MDTKKLFASVAAAAFTLAWSVGAQAIALGPGDADITTPAGPPNPALDAGDVADLFGTTDLTLLYKMDYDNSVESGSFWDAYSTTFSGSPNNAFITWDGPGIIQCPECYLVVKNGNRPQYLFNLQSWDGQVDLDLEGFYADDGAISHVAIFGKAAAKVPEPGTLGLLGLSLVGLTAVRRRSKPTY